MKLLLPKNNVANVLENRFSFSVKLAEQIKKIKVFPTIGNTYISLDEIPRYCDFRFDNIVKPHTFSNLLKHCYDEIVEIYLHEKLSFYSERETVELIDKDADEYANNEKITLIELFLKKFTSYSNNVLKYAPKILCDYNGNRITDDSKVFNNPEKNMPVPDWAKMKFINEEFEKRIKAAFSLSTGR